MLFSQPLRWQWYHKPFPSRTKGRRGRQTLHSFVKVLENLTTSTIQVGITLITILSGAKLADTLGQVIASWMGNGETTYAIASFLSLAFLTYISIVFGELYPKRIALNLKDALAIRSVPIIIGLGKIVSPFVWLLSASTNLLSRLRQWPLMMRMKNDSRWNWYMLTKKWGNFGCRRNRDVTRDFLSRWADGERSHGSSDGCLYGGYSGW